MWAFFFFQAEDGIRDWSVTGVQTCALPIYAWNAPPTKAVMVGDYKFDLMAGQRAETATVYIEIGRASCRERV